ncbi:MAG: DUF2341 domain-containing protein, partial [Candidatus Kariarchaeaceae archaeon]
MISKLLFNKSMVLILSTFLLTILFVQSTGAVFNYEDNNVDEETNRDAATNTGTSDTFNSAQTVDAVDQEIRETNTLEPEENWRYYKRITIDHSKVEADLENFPLLVSLFDSDLKNKAQLDGDDIAFFDDRDVQLAHEIELYNPNYSSTQAQLVAWVRSNLSNSVDTTINMKYGNYSMQSQENPESVWDANKAGVWHLDTLSPLTNSTYYFDEYGASEWIDPQNSIDGSTSTRAHTDWTIANTDATHLFTGNTALPQSTAIKKVYLRGNIDVYGSGEFYLTPIFSGGNGTTRLFQNVYTDWTEWVEITNDPNSPSTWTWTDVNQLDVEIKATDPASHDTSLNKLELRIEHGGDYDDSTSNNNGGSDTGSPLAAIGKIGNAIEFTDPGSNQYIAMPNSASLTISNAITLEAWIYPDVVNKWESIVSKMDGTMGSGSGANEDLYWVLDNSGNHFIGLAGASGYTDWSTGIAATANQWQQVTFTYDGSTSIGRLYIDGIEIDNFNYGRGPLMTNTNPFYIGFNRGWTGEVWDGRIDEVRVSNIVRSAEWITTTFNNQQDPHDFYSVSGEMYFKRYTSYEKSITIDNTKVLTDLVDFPVLVSIYDSDLKVKAQYNGFDITFYDASDAQLAHEIESYDPNYNGTHAELVAWVKTDLSSSEDTPIRMKYGDHAKVSQENPTGVWGSEYKGVWHLGDDPSPYYYDSTYNSNDGIASNSPSNITAIIDGGVSFDDTNERGVSVSHSISLQLPSDIMVSAWIRTTDSDGDVGIVINKWGNAASDRNYWLGKLDANDFAFFVDDSQNVKYPLS